MVDKMLEEINKKVAEAKAQAAKAAVATEPSAPAVVHAAPPPMVPESANWGAIEEIDGGDLLVPKILHQQAGSGFAKEGLARPGDFCDSLTGEILANKNEKLELIVFGLFKNMIISKFDDRKQQYIYEKSVMITPENAWEISKLPYHQDVNGESFKNEKQYNFYCLLPKKINELPYVMSFKGSKRMTAEGINTMLTKLQRLKRPGASVVFELVNTAEGNDKGDWLGLTVKQGRDTTPEELKIAYEWYVKSRTQKIVAADEHATVSEEDVPF